MCSLSVQPLAWLSTSISSCHSAYQSNPLLCSGQHMQCCKAAYDTGSCNTAAARNLPRCTPVSCYSVTNIVVLISAAALRLPMCAPSSCSYVQHISMHPLCWAHGGSITASSCQGQQSKLTVCLIQAVGPCCSYAADRLGIDTGWLCMQTGSMTCEAHVSKCEAENGAAEHVFCDHPRLLSVEHHNATMQP
jgi:hypothetical protein